MTSLFVLLLLISLVLLGLGFFNPNASLFWLKKARTKNKSALIYCSATVLFLILFGVTNDKNESNSSNVTQTAAIATPEVAVTKIEKETPTEKKTTISAADLMSAYEANEVNADNNYKSKTLYVTGKVSDIKKDIADDIYVTLAGANEMSGEVQCYFDNKETAGQLHKGMKVTFKGTCDGLMMNVLMKDCELVDNSVSSNN